MVVDGTALVPVDTALRRLQDEAPERARVIEMRFFEGMKYEEIAMVLHVAPRTARRYVRAGEPARAAAGRELVLEGDWDASKRDYRTQRDFNLRALRCRRPCHLSAGAAAAALMPAGRVSSARATTGQKRTQRSQPMHKRSWQWRSSPCMSSARVGQTETQPAHCKQEARSMSMCQPVVRRAPMRVLPTRACVWPWPPVSGAV